MANIPLERIWRPNLYQWETSDPLIGGAVAVDVNGDIVGSPAGLDNIQGKQLGDRTAFLKWRLGSSGPSMRNTILNTVQTANAPDFIDALGVLVLASPTDPFCVTLAGGFDLHGPVDYLVAFDSNVAIVPEVGTGSEWVYLQYDPLTDTYSIFSSASNQMAIGPDEPNTGTYTYWYHPFLGKTFEWDGLAWNQIYLTIIGFINYAGPSAICGLANIDFAGGSTPAGLIANNGATSAPFGYLLCHGQQISRVGYSRLFAVIGTTFGVGDGSTTFNLPDMRGEFVRGYDAGAGIDTGRVFGSNQAEAVGPHQHYPDNFGDFLFWDPAFTSFDIQAGNDGAIGGVSPTVGLDSETRPRNVALEYIIKY